MSASSILEAFQNSEQLNAIAKAVKEGQSEGLPVGEYTWRFKGGRWAGYTNKKTGAPVPAINLDFEVETSSDDPRLVGRKTQEFLILANRDNGERAVGWSVIEKMYRSSFGEKFPTDATTIPAALQRLADAKGSLWKVNRVQNGEYVNTKILGMVSE